MHFNVTIHFSEPTRPYGRNRIATVWWLAAVRIRCSVKCTGIIPEWVYAITQKHTCYIKPIPWCSLCVPLPSQLNTPSSVRSLLVSFCQKVCAFQCISEPNRFQNHNELFHSVLLLIFRTLTSKLYAKIEQWKKSACCDYERIIFCSLLLWKLFSNDKEMKKKKIAWLLTHVFQVANRLGACITTELN